MFVTHRFKLKDRTRDYLQSLVPEFGYGGFGELVYYRTYSRVKSDGGQETWNDTVIRVVEGVLSIRKDHYVKNRIDWDEEYWQNFAVDFAKFMFDMKWLPPGRGLWAMGSEFVYQRGAMALYNCAFTNLGGNDRLANDVAWLMDCLMNGVGVGFGPLRDDLILITPAVDTYDYRVPDSREGWVDLIWRLLRAWTHGEQKPNPIYVDVRPKGMPIRGFGGVASGPEPLALLFNQIDEQCQLYMKGKIDIVEFKTNLCNLVGCCVVAGNVRRSAEIGVSPISDPVFRDLKDYEKYPHRATYGWMSNNSVMLNEDIDFDSLGEVAKRVVKNGEPGVLNMRNLPYARLGKKMKGLRKDLAIGVNPCSEIPLEDKEVCNLSETLPTRCEGIDEWYKACEYATFYSSTVSLLPTHQPDTNKVVSRNRRIGVGIIDFSGWKHTEGVHKVTRYLRAGYDIIRSTNQWANSEAGVPEAIRVTTMKPGGTVPKIAGRTAGAGNPTFHHTLRRIRVAEDSNFSKLLIDAGIPYEKDFYSAGTLCFEYPILQGPAKPSSKVSLWEQANTIALLQREFSDNAVSNTLYFRPMWLLVEDLHDPIEWDRKLSQLIGQATWFNFKNSPPYISLNAYVVEEKLKVVFNHGSDGNISNVKIYEFDPTHEEDDVEPVLSSTVPVTKSLSLLPHTPMGVYKQMPEEGISEFEYHQRLADIDVIDWSKLRGSDGQDELYCTGDICEIRK